MHRYFKQMARPAMLLIVIWAVSCAKNNENNGSVSGALVSHSECKNGEKNSLATGPADTLSCVEYEYLAENKTLRISHLNAGFNCCPGELSCEADIINHELKITESEEEPGCNCMCLFDLEIEITDLEPGIYSLRLIEPYIGNQAELITVIDLNASPTGTFCVIRKDYPWGMSILR